MASDHSYNRHLVSNEDHDLNSGGIVEVLLSIITYYLNWSVFLRVQDKHNVGQMYMLSLSVFVRDAPLTTSRGGQEALITIRSQLALIVYTCGHNLNVDKNTIKYKRGKKNACEMVSHQQ